MARLNRVFLIGNLTRDPEVRYLPSGVAVGELRLAVTDRFRNKSGELQESTCYVDVVVWSKDAENCEKYLAKGSPILVEGSLQLDEWKTREGENRHRLRVRAIRVQFLGSPRSAEGREAKSDGTATPSPSPSEESFRSRRTEGAPDGESLSADDEDTPPF